MQLRYAQVLAGLQAMQGYLDDNAEVLGDIPSGVPRKALDEITRNISSLADKQTEHTGNKTGELQQERRLATTLRLKCMIPLVRVARVRVPAAAQLDAVKLPRARSNSTQLVSDARAMAAQVEPYAQLLVDGGLQADFLIQLRGGADALEAVVKSKETQLSKRVGATSGISTEVQEMRAQLNVLDSLVKAKLPATDPRLAEWRRQAKRIRSAATRASKASSSTPETGTPAPSPASTVAPVQEVPKAA
jgi:hypothetical protein